MSAMAERAPQQQQQQAMEESEEQAGPLMLERLQVCVIVKN